LLANDGIADWHALPWLGAKDLVTCALPVEYFRELRPAVSGETKGRTAVDGGFYDVHELLKHERKSLFLE